MSLRVVFLILIVGIEATAQVQTKSSMDLDSVYSAVRASESFFKVTFKDEIKANYYYGPFGKGQCGLGNVASYAACYNQERQKVYDKLVLWEQSSILDQASLADSNVENNISKRQVALERLNSILNDIRLFYIGLSASTIQEANILRSMDVVHKRELELIGLEKK
jgi:hypothetical protein